jgi:hypothetical protein
VIAATYGDLFIAIAGAAGALTGLLFVALSVTRRPERGSAAYVIQQVRAAAALLSFTNALAVSLFGLVPGTKVGYPAAVFGMIGIAFTAAAVRSVISSGATRREQLQQLGFTNLLLLVFGTELVAGIVLLAGSPAGTPLEIVGYALVASLLFGVARAWELVGEWNTNLVASIATLVGLTAIQPTAEPEADKEPVSEGRPGGDGRPDDSGEPARGTEPAGSSEPFDAPDSARRPAIEAEDSGR